MPTLLHLDSSPLARSISRELTREYVKTWRALHPDGTVIYRDLALQAPSALDEAWIHASYTPEALRTPEQAAVLHQSDQLIGELERADDYVFGVAMHNFTIPGVFKLWIDQVVRYGRTFVYGQNGPQGLLQGKRATVLSATGGVYDAGSPAETMNFIDPYLKTVFGFIGVTDVKFVTAGGVARVGKAAEDREVFLKPMLQQVRAIAA